MSEKENKNYWIIKDIQTAIVKEVYESFNGDLIFKIKDKRNTENEFFSYVRLYNFPMGQEFGWSNLDYLKSVYGKNKLWKVKKENWGNINSYESEFDLLNEVEVK